MKVNGTAVINCLSTIQSISLTKPNEQILTYFNKRKIKIAVVYVERGILKTSFKIQITVLVKERIKRDDMNYLLKKLSKTVRKSKDLKKLLY